MLHHWHQCASGTHELERFLKASRMKLCSPVSWASDSLFINMCKSIFICPLLSVQLIVEACSLACSWKNCLKTKVWPKSCFAYILMTVLRVFFFFSRPWTLTSDFSSCHYWAQHYVAAVFLLFVVFWNFKKR